MRVIEKSIAWSGESILNLKTRIDDRVCLGIKRDVHGDPMPEISSHISSRLFLIVSNLTIRTGKLTSSVGSHFCVWIWKYINRRDLEQTFITTYKKAFDCFTGPEDYELFNYYKCLRANIRAKVHAINCEQADNETDREFYLGKVKSYLRLIAEYADIG
ncbi:hypothetical protein [Dyadobacter psychrotolerans]|uniref:Uncharacterized protein n=1 Tax=Dyadobacter psychrotolerans TaxID=2541721 RepID=A0A4R5DU59_9BACT|nr:hypothetical protein [Dyadobacter psychrotolerans]TDE17989.1 hypothetical protein E0F88_00040 [Dyadobacter psychrotolerans]